MGESDSPAVRLAGVGQTYRGRGRLAVEALADIDLSVPSGEFLVIVGPSGSGKSTLLRIVAGFIAPSHGSVSVGGALVRGPGPDRGVVFQQPRLFPWLSVRGNVEFGLRTVSRSARRERAAEMLALVGLSDVAELRPYELSGGMQQRAAIARALAPDPRILLLDEPFAALDALTRERLQEELRALWRATGTTVVFVTHSVDEAAYLGTRIVALSARPGRVVLDLASDLPRADEPRHEPAYVPTRDKVLEVVRAAASSAG
jgi:taurine transport system ATP-binding protein